MIYYFNYGGRGIERSVSASEIRKAYRKAALRHHPDKVYYSYMLANFYPVSGRSTARIGIKMFALLTYSLIFLGWSVFSKK